MQQLGGGILGENLGSSASTRYFIHLSGSNVITSSAHGMRFDNSYVVLYGVNLDSHLYIDCTKNTSGYACIDTERGHFEVWGVSLTMAGNGSGFWGNSSQGTLNFINTYANIACEEGAIVKCSRVSFDDAKVITGGLKHDSSKGYVDASGNVVTDLLIRPLLAVGNEPVRTSGSSKTGTGWTWTKDTKTLNITGDIKGYGYPGIANYGVDGLTINADITATVSSGQEALVSYGDVNIIGSGTLTLSSDLSDALRSYAGTVSVKIRVLNAKAKYYGVRADNLKLEAYNSATVYKFSGMESVYVPNLEMNGIDIFSDDTYWDPRSGWVAYEDPKDHSTKPAGETYFTSVEQIDYYNLWIADVHVRTNNTKNIFSRYLKGNVTYNPDKNTLTLNNVTLDYQGSEMSFYGIRVEGIKGLKIDVEGNNTITGKADDFFSGLWLRGGADVELRGDGTLNLGGYFGACLFGSSLTVGDNVKLIVQKVLGSNGLTSTSQYGNLTVKGNAEVRAQFIRGLNELNLLDDRGILQPAYAEFSDHTVSLNDNLAENVVIGELVVYDLVVLGRKVTNATCTDILGNGTMSYDDESRFLSLDNVNGSYDYDGSFILNEGIDGLMIYVNGNNTITLNGDSQRLIGVRRGETSIVGEGTLNSDCGIFLCPDLEDLPFTRTLILEGPTLNLGAPIYGVGSDALIINAGKLTITTNRMPINIRNLVIADDLYITEPYGAWFDSEVMITLNGSSSHFGNLVISNEEPDAVGGVKATDAPTDIYDIAGRRMKQTQRGINILRTTEGTTRKVVVK